MPVDRDKVLQAAQKLVVGIGEDQEGIAQVLARFALVMADPTAEGAARQLIALPGRLPGGQMVAAQRAQLGPRRVVAHRRGAQPDALTAQSDGGIRDG